MPNCNNYKIVLILHKNILKLTQAQNCTEKYIYTCTCGNYFNLFLRQKVVEQMHKCRYILYLLSQASPPTGQRHFDWL